MNRLIAKIRSTFIEERPLIRLYSLLYLVGVFIGVGASILLREQFSEQSRLLFIPENAYAFWPAFLQQAILFALIFLLGMTAVGIPLIPIYPLYKGFSIGLLVGLAIILYGFKGFILGFPTFFIQNFIYTFAGYFVCASSARLSMSIFSLIQGHGKHSATRSEFIHHIYFALYTIPILMVGALWEWKMVPLLLNLF